MTATATIAPRESHTPSSDDEATTASNPTRMLHQDVVQAVWTGQSATTGVDAQPLTITNDQLQPSGEGAQQHQELPTSRFGHTAVLHKDSMYIFGGREQNVYHDDVWEYSFLSQHWTKLDTQPAQVEAPQVKGKGQSAIAPQIEASTSIHCPPATVTATQAGAKRPRPRAGHSAVVAGDSMLVFGGAVSAQRNCSDVWQLDLKTKAWTLLDDGCVEPPVTKRSKPSSRRGHTAIPVGTSMLVFGGCDEFVSDNVLWQWDAEHCEWRIMETVGERPLSRMYHVAQKTERNTMLVFGGRAAKSGEYLNDLFEFDISHKLWRKIQASGSIPSGRMCSSSVARKGVVCIFFGGSDCVCDDSFELNTETMHWRELDTRLQTSEEGTRIGSTCPTTVVHDNTLTLFGGHDGLKAHNSLHTLTLRPPTLKDVCRRWLRKSRIALQEDEFPKDLLRWVNNEE